MNPNTLLKTLDQIQTIEELGDALNTTAEEFNVGKLIITSFPTKESRKLSDHVLWTSLEPQTLNDYDQQEMLSHSTHFDALRKSPQPRIWHSDMIDEHVMQQTTQNIARTRDFLFDNDISMGLSFPIFRDDNAKGAVMFMGDRTDIDRLSLAYLQTISSRAYDLMSEVIENFNDSQSLTQRECEIISWVANGKTSSEISIILSLSDHTVNAHLNKSMNKMNCVSRPQLVAKALRLGLIS